MTKGYARKKSSQMLLVRKDKLESFPQSVKQYIRHHGKEKSFDGVDYLFFFPSASYEKGDKGSAPKTTTKMISEGGLSWLMNKLQEEGQTDIVVFEASWIAS